MIIITIFIELHQIIHCVMIIQIDDNNNNVKCILVTLKYLINNQNERITSLITLKHLVHNLKHCIFLFLVI